MEEFPFSDEEWELLKESALGMVNATFADDSILRASYFIEFQNILSELRMRHGDHPVLLETEADFTDDTVDQISLYEQAKHIALQHGLPTWTIRLSLAKVLLHEVGQTKAARSELIDCRDEVAERGDESEQTTWAELLAECDRQLNASGS